MTTSVTSVAIVGGGPGGLFLASLLKRRRPDLNVTVYEQNQRADAFGFGVVFSDATLRAINEADPVLREALGDYGTHWDRIEVWSGGACHGFSGNGMAAIHRKVLLAQLQSKAEALGTRLLFGARAPALAELRERHDLVVGADGANSSVRQQLLAETDLGHSVEVATAKFIWFGTTHLFEGLTFVHRVSEHGNFAVHGYPISRDLSTFIVETDEATWRRSGLDAFDVDQPPGPSDGASQAYLEELFADDIQQGRLVANNSRWANFRTRRTRRWAHGNVALLGDAVHTAHFSVGSGTKMAMEDAIVLADELLSVGPERDLTSALSAYQEARQRSVARIQGSAGPSLSWWEHFGDYQRHLDPLTFAFHFFSRSIDIDKIALRDPALAEEVRAAWRVHHGADPLDSSLTVPGSGGDAVGVSRRLQMRSIDDEGLALLQATNGHRVEVPVVRVEPSDDTTTDSLSAQVTSHLPRDGAVVVLGPPGVARTLVAEEARLRRGLVTVMAGDDLADTSSAETQILSGRADAIAVPTQTGFGKGFATGHATGIATGEGA